MYIIERETKQITDFGKEKGERDPLDIKLNKIF